ncbi:MAG: hypothetical protein IPG28_06345 [Betaproteobacteria bacterium]|nr:hypothetical protein [Betaproteobacteria bacterium]
MAQAISRARRNVLVLAIGQALMLSAVVLAMTLAGIVGAVLAPDKGLATLPVAAMVLGTAIASIPASLLMRRVGRRAGFVVGATIGAAGSVLAALGIQSDCFATFVAGHLLVGSYQGFANYYRFAAAEAAGPLGAGRAISWVVAGGVVAAFVGPQIAVWGRDWLLPHLFMGSYLAEGALSIAALTLLALLQLPAPKAVGGEPARPLTQIARQPGLRAAIVGAVIGYMATCDVPMQARRFRTLPLLFLLAALSGPTTAVVPDEVSIPPLPTFDQLPLEGPMAFGTGASAGTLTWIGSRPVKNQPLVDLSAKERQCWAWELVKRSWNPGTGERDEHPLGLPGMVIGQTPVATGILTLTELGCQTPNSGERLRVALFPAQGPPRMLETTEMIAAMPWRIVSLNDNTAAIVTRVKSTRHILVYVVRHRGNRLTLERMPELPIAYNGDFATAVASTSDSLRLMILGGSDGRYRGCMECRNETHFLDIRTATWSAGPPMLEARAEHDATGLPDGSVLVTGGWTKKAEWGKGPSATAERWNPATNRFEAVAPMPTGTALHRGFWLPGQEGKSLLITQGLSGTAQAYDLATQTWRTVGSWGEGRQEGAWPMPFTFEGNAYAWRLNRAQCHDSNKDCMGQKYYALSLLRPLAGTNPSNAPASEFLITYRGGTAFVPAATRGKDERPALIIGGIAHAGMNNYIVTATVEAVGRDGRMWAFPSLNNARSDARAFRFGDGVLVVGGWVARSSNNPELAARKPPMEWLAASALDGKASWVEVGGPGPAVDSALAQLQNGSLLEVNAAGEMTEWKPVLRAGSAGQPSTLTLERHAWPKLNRARRATESSPISVRELADGRIIVAGGEMQVHKIALMSGDSHRADAADEYVGIGPYLPSRRHEIYDPATRLWKNSAPARASGGPVVVLDDGRVMKVGTLADESKTVEIYGKTDRRVLEISNAEGTAWTELPTGLGAGSRMRFNDQYKAFTVDGELFVSGGLADLGTGGGPSGVEWFNAATNRWEVLWQSMGGDSWRAHQGRILVPKLANGKTVVLPVEGF